MKGPLGKLWEEHRNPDSYIGRGLGVGYVGRCSIHLQQSYFQIQSHSVVLGDDFKISFVCVCQRPRNYWSILVLGKDEINDGINAFCG